MPWKRTAVVARKHKKKQERLRERFYSKRLRAFHRKGLIPRFIEAMDEKGNRKKIKVGESFFEQHQTKRTTKGRIKRAMKRGRMR